MPAQQPWVSRPWMCPARSTARTRSFPLSHFTILPHESLSPANPWTNTIGQGPDFRNHASPLSKTLRLPPLTDTDLTLKDLILRITFLPTLYAKSWMRAHPTATAHDTPTPPARTASELSLPIILHSVLQNNIS